ncbi:MAG: 16S rRNA (cytosine(967)-C(5))-methyltransferase RsmB [Oligoflexia bacterium]|nr:16S rRNA (cytosine(967)-C(5))-methyltransferase RsmB [Oligoflexia bacterium]
MPKPNRPRNAGFLALRRRAISILSAVLENGAYADILLSKARDELSVEQSALISTWIKGVLEHKGELDSQIAPLLKQPLDKLPIALQNTLRLGLFQLRFMEKALPAGVVSESVEVVKSMGSKGKAALVNAVLRKLSTSPVVAVNPLQNIPNWINKRWERQYGASEARKLAEALALKLPLSLAVNPLRTSRGAVRSALEAKGCSCRDGQLLDRMLLIDVLPRATSVTALPGFQEGHFFVQDESSAIVAELVGVQPTERVYDLCSAPGGKACWLAISQSDRGSIVAWDRSSKRLERVRENVNRLGLRSIDVRVGDALALSSQELVDVVLLDAPCSGLGTLARKADQRWLRTETEMSELIKLQSSLLEKAALMVRPGGRLVYSTCSIDRQENEDQVNSFLSKHSDFALMELPQWLQPKFRSKCGRFYLSLPHRTGMAGAFAVCLVRN